MKNSKHKINWLIDVFLFGGFLLAFLLDFTGLSLHQWLGVVISVLAAYHLIVHWDWVEAITARFLTRTSKQARSFYLVDAGLLFGFLLVLETGLLISTWFAIELQDYIFWVNFHLISSLVTLLLVVIKIGIHGRWIVNTARRYFSLPAATAVHKPVPAPSRITTERREFLKLMGVVGTAAFLAAINALNVDDNVLAITSSGENELPLQPDTYAHGNSGQIVSSDDCVIRCNRGCSYPGHCRRYTDTNGNNLCDLGECV